MVKYLYQDILCCVEFMAVFPMALSVSYSLLCFLLPTNAGSCFPVSFSCGNFILGIKPPFTTTAHNPQCGGSHLIKCDGNITLIQFKSQGLWYRLMNISYSENILIVQDLLIGDPSWGSRCSCLCDFLKPFTIENMTRETQILAPEQQFFDCTTVEHQFSQEFLMQFGHFTPCRDYNFYYTQKLDNRTLGALPTNCLARRPPSFEWRLLFSEDGGLSLLSAGLSHQLELRRDCFDCQVIGNNCSVNARGSICNPAGHSIAKRKIKIGVVVGIGGLLLAFLFLFCFQCHRRKFGNAIFFVKMETKSARTIKAFLEKHGSLTPKTYTYSEVKKITKSFSNKLGQGGYGTVFKGKLDNGHEVAVKMLSESKGNGEEFINEIASIGRTSHVNIVTLLGFCLEGSKRALIYDFMPNGSLEKYIYSEKSNRTRPLGWETLYKIAIGIAQGLEYLHRGCNTRIVHFDIKPHNILLDEDFCPKISDFGLAKLCSGKDSILSIDSGARGTIGYIAPEVFSRNFGVVSSKSDVYSYGMMVLEMAGGRKNINATVDKSSEIYFPHWIYEHLGRHGMLRDWELSHETEEIARKMILVGLWCIQTLPDNRPSMNKVVDMLQGSITDLQMPPKPYLSSPLGSTIGSLAISAT